LKVSFTDERAEGGKPVEFHYEGGIRDFVGYINETKDIVHKHVVYFDGSSDQGEVEVAMQWNASRTRSRCSRSPQHQHARGRFPPLGLPLGAHVDDHKYARDKGLLKRKRTNLEGEDVREGLAAVISVKLQNPQFEGQTKTKLGNPGISGLVSTFRQPEARGVLRGEPTEARRSSARRSPRRGPGRLRASARAHATQSRRSSRCHCRASSPTARSRDPEAAELFIVEGDSGRRLGEDGPRPHLPGDPALRGKIINSEKNRINKVLSNNEIQAMITAIGTSIGDEFDLEKLRYHRVIVMTDADVDGSHNPHADPDVPLPADAGADRPGTRVTSPCRRSTR